MIVIAQETCTIILYLQSHLIVLLFLASFWPIFSVLPTSFKHHIFVGNLKFYHGNNQLQTIPYTVCISEKMKIYSREKPKLFADRNQNCSYFLWFARNICDLISTIYIPLCFYEAQTMLLKPKAILDGLHTFSGAQREADKNKQLAKRRKGIS
jgi:hypothetical protein